MIDFTRINNDVNGNPRYVCHYLDFKPYSDQKQLHKLAYVKFEYMDALNTARKFGGKKFHNKQYGGGIVFQSYNIEGLSDEIQVHTGEMVQYHRGPNAYELKMGYGATHHRAFKREDVTNRKGELKKWFKADDGLNYSRS